MRDAIVIGAGLAGLMSALALAERGLRPLVLAKGQGATHWSTGCIDLLAPDEAGELLPQARLAALMAARPEHPYAIVGMDAIAAAWQRLQALSAEAGYPLVGTLQSRPVLPTAAGALRPTCLLPTTMVAGDMRLRWTGSELLVVGFHELRDFFPPLIAANLTAQGYPARAVYLELPPSSRRLVFTAPDLARLFDEPAFRAGVGRQLRAIRGTARRIAFPAILGMRHAPRVVADLQEWSGALVFEIPTLPPSVPGIRLYELLRIAVERAGGRIQLGSRVVRAEGHAGRLQRVWSEAAAREQPHTAGCWVLATGGIGGGGLVSGQDGRVRETALDLPVQAPAGRGAWFSPRLLAPHGHPIYQSGVRVDAHLRPCDHDGQPIYTNVAVAGIALAGFDPVREGCYEGVAVTTGWAAGQVVTA